MSVLPATNGAGEIARVLKLNGIKFVFALCGDHINSLFMALDDAGIRIIDFRQESAGVQMADGYARATGRPAVCVVTGGPGHSNAITGLAVSQSAGTPVILISGQTPIDQWPHGGQQTMRQADIAASVTKWAMDVTSPDRVGELVNRAIRIAQAPKSGPVSLSVSPNILENDANTAGTMPVHAPIRAFATKQVGEVDGFDGAVDLVRGARKPVVIAGSGVFTGSTGAQSADALRRLGAPVFTIDQARGLLPDGAAPCFGYADPLFNPTFRRTVEADVVVLAGAALDFHSCFAKSHLIAPTAKIVQMSEVAFEQGMNRAPDMLFDGPVPALLDRLAHEIGQLQIDEWLLALTQDYGQQRAYLETSAPNRAGEDSAIHPLDLMRALSPYRTPETTIVVDVGDFIHWPRVYFEALEPRKFHDGVLTGNLGSAIPLGIGAQYANPDKAVWAFCGDGGYQLHTWELATARTFGLPIKLIVGNDRAWGVELRLQRNEFGRDVGCLLPNVAYHEVARSLGVGGFHATRREQLEETISAFLAHEGPAVLNVEIPRMCGRPFANFRR